MKNKILPIERITLAIVESFIAVVLLLGALFSLIMPSAEYVIVPVLVVLIAFTAVQSVMFRKRSLKVGGWVCNIMSAIKWGAAILGSPFIVLCVGLAGNAWVYAADATAKGSFQHIMVGFGRFLFPCVIIVGIAAIAALVLELVFAAKIKKRNAAAEREQTEEKV